MHSKVEQVHEFYADFHAISPEVFSLNLGGSLHLAKPTGGVGGRMSAAEARFQRSVDGVMSVLLAHKLKPVIRFQQTSGSAGHFARAVDSAMGSQRELFSLLPHAAPPPVLLILDRREDPLTPLLTQWTYQAMIHETLGLWGNRVVIKGDGPAAAGASASPASAAVTHVVDAAHDAFYAEHMCSHFVDVAEAVQSQLKEVQRKQKDTGSMSSIEEMRRVMERLPAMRRENANVVKHFAIMAELHRQDEAHKLFELTRLEQDMSEQDAAARHCDEVRAMVEDPAVRARDALRLVLLYALRYETDAPGRVAELKVALASRGLLPGDVAMVDALLDYAGARVRGGDLFGKKTIMARFRRGVSRSLKGLQEAETPHKPVMEAALKGETHAAPRPTKLYPTNHPTTNSPPFPPTLPAPFPAELSSGTLSTSLFPFAGRAEAATTPASTVVVFVLGGATFEEAHVVHGLNTTPGSTMRVILGGTVIQNSGAFIEDLAQLAKEAAGGMATPGPAAAGGPSAAQTSVFSAEGLGFGTGLVQQRGGSSYGTLS